MMTATNPSFSREDDAYQCVDRMRPELQKIINQCSSGDAFMTALSICFAELLRDRGGDDEPLLRTMDLFMKRSSKIRKETQRIHAQLKTLVAATRSDDFTLDAILWSTVGAITNVMAGIPSNAPNRGDYIRMPTGRAVLPRGHVTTPREASNFVAQLPSSGRCAREVSPSERASQPSVASSEP
jgi:hypothetical protein